MVTTNREKTVNCRSVGVNSSARPSTNPNSTAFPFCSPSTESSPLLGLSLKVGFRMWTYFRLVFKKWDIILYWIGFSKWASALDIKLWSELDNLSGPESARGPPVEDHSLTLPRSYCLFFCFIKTESENLKKKKHSWWCMKRVFFSQQCLRRYDCTVGQSHRL